jgi:hypothetical protein
MNSFFDDLAREVARGISRREVLRGLVLGLGGLLLSSIGLKKARAAALTCGTCQACDLDTNTCGLPCNPPSVGQTLCNKVEQDGSYLRLSSYLTNHSFLATGSSSIVFLYQGGQLFGSGLATSFTSSTTSGETAVIQYVVGSNGDITTYAVVSQNGAPIHALNVNFDGRVVVTVASKTFTTTATTTTASAAVSSQWQKSSVDTLTLSPLILRPLATTSPGTCNELFDALCGKVGAGIICGIIGALLCTEGGPVAMAICGIIAGIICAFPSDAACKAAQAGVCACPNNEVTCNGMCCGPCMDCQIGPGAPKGECVPSTTCEDAGLGPCCGNNQCCPDGYTCNNGTCTSPNSGCAGATCTTFVPCSSSNPDCVCGSIVEGGGLCVPGSTPCAGLAPCSSSADCGADALCLFGSCCGEPVCVPISLAAQCPTSATPTAAFAVPRNPQTASGPTIGHR